MSKESEVPWLLALVPPPDVAKRIDDLRHEFSANFSAFKALKPPVHLTLFTVLKLPAADMAYHIDKLRRAIAPLPSFPVALKNFGFFEKSKPVVFIDVIKSEALKHLNTVVTRETKKLFGLGPVEVGQQTFNPHITIGYRDIPPEVFPQVKQAYRNRPFSAGFIANGVNVFRHDGRMWVEAYQLPFTAGEVAQGSLW